MALPRFLDRALDAAVPVLGGLDRDAVRTRLEGMTVALCAGETTADSEALRAGFLLAANLAARLYPRILLSGTEPLIAEAANSITKINPVADVVVLNGDAADELPSADAVLGYELALEFPAASVFARGWNVYVGDAGEIDEPANALAALFAAALGVGEVFRTVFAAELGRKGRTEAVPASLNLVTLGEAAPGPAALPADLDLEDFRLVGAGAIGQAAAHALAAACCSGTMLAVDDEPIELSNLQRYVQTVDTDQHAVKVDLLKERLGGSRLNVLALEQRWDAGLAEECLPTLVALDTPEDRIAVQASLPGRVYNAWTQPADLGWSRHEHFGDEPCLACLYWPQGERPSRHEQIAAAFGQHPLRVLAYLVHHGITVGQPLPLGSLHVIPGTEPPPDAARWHGVGLIDDIAQAAGLDPTELDGWRGRSLADLYQDGICGGALLHLEVGDAPREVVVPLAHQSALAGIMLATQFVIAQVDALRAARSSAIEGRFDVLAGLPQRLARPRARTPNCICSDSVFLDVYGHKFPPPAEAA